MNSQENLDKLIFFHVRDFFSDSIILTVQCKFCRTELKEIIENSFSPFRLDNIITPLFLKHPCGHQYECIKQISRQPALLESQ